MASSKISLVIPAPKYETLVLKGGGIKGVGYLGQLNILHEKGVIKDIKHVSGSSAGSIAALLLALNYSQEELNQELKSVDFNQFKDYSNSIWNKLTRGVFENIKSFFGYEHGLYEGDFLRAWLDSKISAKLGKPNATFKDLAIAQKSNPLLKNLIVTGTNFDKKTIEFFSIDESPNVCIADAVRISSSIPGFFKQVFLNKATGEVALNQAMLKTGNYKGYVDGGFLDNFPIEYFSQQKFENINYPVINAINPSVLGLRIDSTEEQNAIFGIHINSTIIGIWNWLKSIVSTPLSDHNNLRDHGYQIISSNDFGVGATDLDLSMAMKEKLIAEAQKAAEKYFELYVDGSGYLLQFESLKHLLREHAMDKGELELLEKDRDILSEELTNRLQYLKFLVPVLEKTIAENTPINASPEVLGAWRTNLLEQAYHPKFFALKAEEDAQLAMRLMNNKLAVGLKI